MAVVPFALSFGAVSVTSGLSLLQTCLLSLVLFSGASQFALVSILGAGGSAASAVGTALLLGARNGLYAMRLAPLLRLHGWRRPLAAQVTIDESTAMALGETAGGESTYAFWVTALSVYVLWNAGTLAGALLGRGLASPAAAGLDAAGPAAFLALLGPRLRQRPMLALAVLAAAVALATVGVLPAGAPVLAGGAVALLAGVRRR